MSPGVLLHTCCGEPNAGPHAERCLQISAGPVDAHCQNCNCHHDSGVRRWVLSTNAPCPNCGCSWDQSALTTKPTNPKDAIGSTKVPFALMPDQVVGEVALALLEGACKYGAANWRDAGVRATVYLDAARRHLADFREGVDIDPASGLSHITKAIAGLVVLRDSMLQGNWVDDRPLRGADPEWLEKQNALAREILARFPTPKQPHTQIPDVLRK